MLVGERGRPWNNPDMRVPGTIALVTGASSGIGAATALALAGRGARVLLHGRNEVALAELASRTGGTVLVEDLADPGAAARLARAAGEVDILVANAGTGYAGDLSTMDQESITSLLQANLTAPIQLTRALLPGMLERGRGSLVYVTSIAGRMGVAGEAVYAATKAGLDTFAESLRLELAGRAVSVGVLVPGVVATPFFERRGRPYGRSRPRPVSPERVAHGIVRLVETGCAVTYVPRWLPLPVAVRALAPGAYRRLAGRFGGS
jgi:short-subunit dehydrogenase